MVSVTSASRYITSASYNVYILDVHPRSDSTEMAEAVPVTRTYTCVERKWFFRFVGLVVGWCITTHKPLCVGHEHQVERERERERGREREREATALREILDVKPYFSKYTEQKKEMSHTKFLKFERSTNILTHLKQPWVVFMYYRSWQSDQTVTGNESNASGVNAKYNLPAW